MGLATCEPTQVYAGDTVTWRKTLYDYPPTAGWTLHYSAKNGEQAINFDAGTTSDGLDYLVSVSATDSSEWNPGDYILVGYVTNATEKYVVSRCEFKILPNLASTEPYDARTFNRKMLDGLNELLLAEDGILEAQISGYMWRYKDRDALEKARDRYAHRVLREEGRLPAFHGARFG